MEIILAMTCVALAAECITNYLNSRKLDRMEEETQVLLIKLTDIEETCKRKQLKVQKEVIPWGRHIGGLK